MYYIQEYISLPKATRQQHLNLDENCIFRGGDSIQFRGLLAYYLNTEIPSGYLVHCCHACHNPDCSNPKHLYWGTPSENMMDKYSAETEEQKGQRRKNRSGENNGRYQCKPWETNNGSIESWKKAGDVFDYYQQLGGTDSIPWGKGPAHIQKVFGVAQGSSKRMIELFQEGWNPRLDKDWMAMLNR